MVVPGDDERPRGAPAELREHLVEREGPLCEEVERRALAGADGGRPDEGDEPLRGDEGDPQRSRGELVGEDGIQVEVAVVEALLERRVAREHLAPRAAAGADEGVELGAAAARGDAAGVLQLRGWRGEGRGGRVSVVVFAEEAGAEGK